MRAPKRRTPLPRLRPVIEALEPRAMLAGLGPESWSAGGIGSPSMGAGAFSTSGAILACSSPMPGSSGTASLQPGPAAAAGSGGLPAVLFDASETGVSGARSQPGSTGSTALTLSSSAPAPSITPLVFHPGSDNGAVFASGVWTGNESGVQFNMAAQQEHEPTGQPLPIGKPGQPVLIVSGSQPGSQVPFNGTTTSTTTSVGGSLVPPSGAGSYSVFAAVGGVFGVIGGASQAALGIGVVAASGAATAASEGGLSPLTVPIIIGGSVVVAHGLDQVWAGATTIWTGQPQRPYAAQALDPLTGNETTSDLANAGVGIVFSLGSGAYANGAQIAGQVAGSGDEIAKELNKVLHLFPRAEKNLAALVEASGSELNALRAVQAAANRALAEGRLVAGPNGVLPGNGLGAVLTVNGVNIRLIGGRIVNGVVEIGSIEGL